MHRPLRPTWIEIDAAALANNVQEIRRRIGPRVQLMAVIKANAYGHGAVDAARILRAAGADQFAVAALNEAVELRDAGVDAPILVLGYTPAWLAEDAARHDVKLTVYDLPTVQAMDAAAQRAGRRLTVHVKVNTGMNRLGLVPAETPAFLSAMRGLEHVRGEGIYTHFATSDAADKRHAVEQFARFQALLAELESTGLRPPVAHAANSAAVLTLPQTHLDMVRCGIALYGLDPDADDTPLPAGFRPVLSWKAYVAQVRALEPGDAVSYGREFIATQPMITAVAPVGYADGFPRRPRHWGSVLIHGQPAPILGRVCMDQTIVDVTGVVAATGEVRMGDEVVLIGRQGEAELRAEEVGRRLGTINYDVTSRILPRVPRVVIGG